jgi:antibiotic biosynthesis monooxygenase (ABM) superfamily enzyme
MTPPQPRPAPLKPPPRWKFAVLVWLAIYPALTVVLWLASPHIIDWPLALRTLALTAVLVPLMVFLLIPALQRLLGPWLHRH